MENQDVLTKRGKRFFTIAGSILFGLVLLAAIAPKQPTTAKPMQWYGSIDIGIRAVCIPIEAMSMGVPKGYQKTPGAFARRLRTTYDFKVEERGKEPILYKITMPTSEYDTWTVAFFDDLDFCHRVMADVLPAEPHYEDVKRYEK